MTKEEILGLHLPLNHPQRRNIYTLNGKDFTLIHIEDCLKAMEEYAEVKIGQFLDEISTLTSDSK